MENATRPKRTQTPSYRTGPCNGLRFPKTETAPTLHTTGLHKTTPVYKHPSTPLRWGSPSLSGSDAQPLWGWTNSACNLIAPASASFFPAILTISSLYASGAQLLQLTCQREKRPSARGATSPSCSQARGPSASYLSWANLDGGEITAASFSGPRVPVPSALPRQHLTFSSTCWWMLPISPSQ